MAPPRRKKDRHLPPCVHLSHGQYYLVKKNKWLPLGRTEADMYAALAKIAGEKADDNMNALFDRYQAEIIPKKAPRTQTDNLAELANLRAVFGHMSPTSIKMIHGYKYLDARGQTAKTRANREISLLSHVLGTAVRWGILEANPLQGIRKHQEKARTRYVEDWEFLAVHDLAPPIVQAAMQFAAITGLRQGDILALQHSQFRDDGLHVTPAKTRSRTGRKQIFEWTAGLKAAYDHAKNCPRRVQSATWVIATQDGQKYTSDGFKTLWQRTIDKALKAGAIQERFNFHDLRSKAASDCDQDATKLLGHENPATTRKHYDRKPSKVKPIK